MAWCVTIPHVPIACHGHVLYCHIRHFSAVPVRYCIVRLSESTKVCLSDCNSVSRQNRKCLQRRRLQLPQSYLLYLWMGNKDVFVPETSVNPDPLEDAVGLACLSNVNRAPRVSIAIRGTTRAQTGVLQLNKRTKWAYYAETMWWFTAVTKN